jgi:hypothetical protein
MMLSKLFSRNTLLIPSILTIALLSGCDNSPKPKNSDNLDKANTAFELIDITSPTASGSMAPHLAVTPAGNAVMSWLEPTVNDAYAVKYSILQNDSWSTPITVAEDKGWFVNWADTPSVVPLTEKQWAAHWLVKQPGGTYSYNIALSSSSDGGQTWLTPQTPHDDNTPTEHGFVSLFPWSDATGAVWLDGRNMKPDGGAASDKEYGGMTLRFARFNYDGNALEEGEIDSLVCDCCMTDVAMASAGPVVVYRNRTTEEIRDISVARYVDGTWSEPITVSDDQWHMPGCPVNGPAITANGDLVAVVWFGAPDSRSRVKLVWSQDAGQTFSAPVALDATVSGRVDVALLPNGSAMVSWVSLATDGISQIRARQVNQLGELGPIQLITEGKFSRNTGFPQMVVADDRLVFAWPLSGKSKQVNTAYLPLK